MILCYGSTHPGQPSIGKHEKQLYTAAAMTLPSDQWSRARELTAQAVWCQDEGLMALKLGDQPNRIGIEPKGRRCSSNEAITAARDMTSLAASGRP